VVEDFDLHGMNSAPFGANVKLRLQRRCWKCEK